MSMTREQAIAIINDNLAIASEHITQVNGLEAGSNRLYMALEALTILAPSPRKEPPTVDEVGDEEDCWWFYERRCYIRAKGSEIREDWEEGEQWLPYSALPKGVE